MIEKEAEVKQQEEIKAKGSARGKKRAIDDIKDKDSAPATPSSAAAAPAKKSHKKKKV